MFPKKEGVNYTIVLPLGEGTTIVASALDKRANMGVLGFGTQDYIKAPIYQLPVQLNFMTPEAVDGLIEYLEEIREAMYKERDKNKGEEE